MRRAVSLVKRKKWLFIAVFFLLILLWSLGISMKAAFFITALTLTAALSTYYRVYMKFTLGFETVTLATVLTTVVYGPFVGIAVGLVSSFAAEFIPQLIDPSSFFWILSYIPAALAVAFLHSLGVPLFWLGMAATLIQNAIAEPIRLFSGDTLLRGMGVFSVTGSFISNLILFGVVAQPLLSLML
ncbi:hypothetical protein HYY74_04650 [Candidatus Woesearchaeota archaeon]|nr:hypothetical protein [Candidatus Woesearchaeota archaeon]